MKIIVTDNNTQEIIIYNVYIDKFDRFIDNKDDSEIIEEKLSEYHNSSEISWMHIREEYEIKYRNI